MAPVPDRAERGDHRHRLRPAEGVSSTPDRGRPGAAASAVGLFPLFLKLAGREVLLVGGGPVAVSKLDALLAAGARVTVVAPSICAELRRAGVRLEERPFRSGDVDRMWLVVAAAPSEVNAAVARAAEARRVFLNAVDDPERCSAYLGSVLRRGSVTCALSTDGRAPALAALLREGLEALLPCDLELWLEQAELLRGQWRRDPIPHAARRPLLLEALGRLYALRGPGR